MSPASSSPQKLPGMAWLLSIIIKFSWYRFKSPVASLKIISATRVTDEVSVTTGSSVGSTVAGLMKVVFKVELTNN